MEDLFRAQQKLVPDLLVVMEHRYRILKYVRFMQPIGRRILANYLGMTERVLRGEVLFLKEQGLLYVTASGMSLTVEGANLMRQLEPIMGQVSRLKELEDQLKRILNIEEVIVVAGDSDENNLIKKEIGRACAHRMKAMFAANNIIAVTGGSTVAAVAEMMPADLDVKDLQLLFVPARGGLGEQVENQANMICAKMAEKTNSRYRLLHVPEEVSGTMYESIIEEPLIKEGLEIIKSASIVVHGIGDAMTMANRRNTTIEIQKKLMDKHAVGEAFGYYFDEDGEIIHKVYTIGMQLEDLKNIPFVIAVAGGHSKAHAIAAFMKQGQDKVLITDEGAAEVLIRDKSRLK